MVHACFALAPLSLSSVCHSALVTHPPPSPSSMRRLRFACPPPSPSSTTAFCPPSLSLVDVFPSTAQSAPLPSPSRRRHCAPTCRRRRHSPRPTCDYRRHSPRPTASDLLPIAPPVEPLPVITISITGLPSAPAHLLPITPTTAPLPAISVACLLFFARCWLPVTCHRHHPWAGRGCTPAYEFFFPIAPPLLRCLPPLLPTAAAACLPASSAPLCTF